MTIILLSKSFVKEHQRHKKDGSVYTVLAHYNKRVKKNTEHAPEHGHDLSHLNDDDKARFNQMHAEQHLAKHYDEHAIKQQLQDSRAEHDKLIRDADVQDKLGDHKAATRLRNKAIKVNQHMMRFQRQLSKLEEKIQGIGKMKEKLVAGSGELVHDAAAHAHYVSKLGAKFKGRIMFIKKVTKPKQPFIPTHTLSDGVPARHVEGNIYIDKDGDEVQDHYAEPVAGKADDNKQGDFGPILHEFYHDANGAIAKLTELQDGEAVAALHHPDVGDIDLVWGKEGTAKSDGYGLSKLIKYHPEVLSNLQGLLLTLTKNDDRSTERRIQLESKDHQAGIKLDWDGKKKTWLLTAFEKKTGNNTLTDTIDIYGKDDTARSSSSPDKTIPQSPENATQKDSPKEGERNAEGLVFHDGRWHREGDNADKSARFHADIKALKETNFKYKAGDKVIDKESGKKYMVLSSYIQDGQVRYTVYPPGKKSSVGHHIWIKESDLVNSGNDEAKKPAKVVSIKEVTRKPESKSLLAPNGKPSNLNAMQHAQVRTAKFKEWFGDWLYNPNMEMTPIKLVDDPNMPIDGDAKTLSKYLRNTYGNTKEINQQTGNEIGFYRDGIEASVKNRKLLSRRLYVILPQLLREAAYAGYEENTKLDKKPHVLGYETYYAAVSIDGKVYSVRIAVDRIKNDVRGRGYYYHQVDEVSLGDEVGSTRVLSDSTNQVNTPSSPNGKIILSQLTGKVNNNASKVVDENGEPLVVYHGSDDNFDTFLKEKIGSNIALPNGAPRGFYFAKDKEVAKKYGKNINEYFISSEPLLNNSKIVVAGEPSQIKSATGNNGDFSKKSNDIYKSQIPKVYESLPINPLILFNIRVRRAVA